MSDTPRTDATEQLVKGPNPWSPHDSLAVPSELSRQLELELKSQGNRLAEWERLFETTNPTQAKAELLAVQEKRLTLQRERSHATDIIIDQRRLIANADKEIASLKAELDEAHKAPERSEEQ